MGEGEAVERGVDVNAGSKGEEEAFFFSSPSPQRRVGGSCRLRDSAACVDHEQERKPEVMGASSVLPPPSSFQSYQSSCETKRFSFQRLVPR